MEFLIDTTMAFLVGVTGLILGAHALTKRWRKKGAGVGEQREAA
ncbi:hypothetical protein [Candidatus Nitrospira bockiana]